MQKPREIAARILLRRERDGGFVENLLDEALTGAELTPADRHLCQELAYGAVRWQKTLDWLVGQKTGGREQKPELAVLLRLGLYQIFWLDRIPPHAAVHETVELARHFRVPRQAGFLNAIFRSYLREQEATREQLKNLKTSQPALGFSHPEWLANRWLDRWGAEKTGVLLGWNNTPPPTFARINNLKTSAEALARQWKEEGVQFTPKQWDWTGDGLVFQLDAHPSLPRLPSFQQGLFYVQDPSTLLAVKMLDPQPDETILDLCAAPGGKTTFIAQIMQNRGRIIAQDNHPERLEMVRKNYIRLGITCIDISAPPEPQGRPPIRRYDRILLDVPCSNTGVLRRRVDLRWRTTSEEIQRLAKTQRQILDQTAGRLRPGGLLIYSTCSLEPEENRAVVEAFLAKQPNFKLEKERELLPFADTVDGAYVATLRLASNAPEAAS